MQIYRFANRLAQLGLESIVIQGSEEFLPDWFDIYPVFKRLSLSQYKNTAFSKTSDYLVIPETFIPHYFALPDVKKIIFNQKLVIPLEKDLIFLLIMSSLFIQIHSFSCYLCLPV